MAFKFSPQLQLQLLLLAAHVISARELGSHSHKSAQFVFPQCLEGSRKGNNIEGIHNVKIYLHRYGYLTNDIETDYNVFDDALESALITYQRNYRLNVSGVLDRETLAVMSKPRCGLPDIVQSHNNKNISQAHFTFMPGLPKWPKSKYHLTYGFIKDFPPKFAMAVREAFEQWEGNSVFTFSPATRVQSADITLSFERGDHGDPYPFDGPWGKLAHAFRPGDGRVHFDADENWVVGPREDAFDLVMVALHELGHALGLGHSFIQEAVMWAYLDPGVSKGLNMDDIVGLQTLYSEK
ncbi:metalloendoproteinase 1-like [Momordica charantia]|uniref:Metalloendoproteinase 1-like n=1 Tax=Momordica charantia TaxID=3673 RepID=A0A6J1BVK9_MOMCH|nr:metalloendoproteinase 1-like [Momordica charantia]